jgi:hypothetical protein
MVTASQSSTSADAASAPGSAKRRARHRRLIALLGLATGGIGSLLTGISVAQQSPEIVEAIGDAYQIGRMRVNGGMVVQTILYNGRPIATGVMLPTRGEVATAAASTTLAAAGALEIAGTVLSGEVSGKYFILHRARGNRSTIHEIFFDGESIGQVAEDSAPTLAGEPPGPGNESRDGKNSVTRASAFSFESAGDALVVHIVQRDGTTIRAISRNGGRLEQGTERRAVAAAVPVVAGNASPVVSRNSDRFIPGNAEPVVSRSATPVVLGDVDRVVSRNAGPLNSGNNDIAKENAIRDEAASGPEDPPPAPSPGGANQSAVHDDDPAAVSSVNEPLKTAPPKIHIPLPRPPVRTAVHAPAAIPEPSRRPVTSLNPFATTAPAPPRPQRTTAPAPPSPRAQVSRTAPQRTTP